METRKENIEGAAGNWYNTGGATRNGRRLALGRGTEPSDYIEISGNKQEKSLEEEGMRMISLEELIQFTELLISVATLFYVLGRNNGKKK